MFPPLRRPLHINWWCIDKSKNNDHFHDALKCMRTKALFYPLTLRSLRFFLGYSVYIDFESFLLSAGLRFSFFFGLIRPTEFRKKWAHARAQHKCLNLVAEMCVVVALYQCRAKRHTKHGSAKRSWRNSREQVARKKAPAVIRTHRREIKKKIGNHFIFRVFGSALSFSLFLYCGYWILFTLVVVVVVSVVCVPIGFSFYFLFCTWTKGNRSRFVLFPALFARYCHLCNFFSTNHKAKLIYFYLYRSIHDL